MPSDARVGDFFDLPPELLGIVLAQVGRAEFEEWANDRGRVFLVTATSVTDRGRLSRRAAGGGDSDSHGFQVLTNAFQVHKASVASRGNRGKGISTRGDDESPRIDYARRGKNPGTPHRFHQRTAAAMKPLLLILGFLSAGLIIMQLTLGQLILAGSTKLVKAHQHSGYLTVVTTLIYIALSLMTVASMPKREKP